MRFRTLASAVALLALGACDQPKWREGDKAAVSPAADPAAPTAAGAKLRAIPSQPGPTPAPPAWASAVIGKTLREVYPKTAICKGNTDLVQQTYAGSPPGVQLHGWGWYTAAKAHVERVVLVDSGFRIVGAGQGGVARPDVPQNLPEVTDPDTGWNADAPLTAGPIDAYGVVGEAICPLGHIEF